MQFQTPQPDKRYICKEDLPGHDKNPFQQLRAQTHAAMEAAYLERIKKNPIPTEEELFVGVFQEDLEPQVRRAVFEMYRRGYSTNSSGFGGTQGEIQVMDGFFVLDQKTKKKLRKMGVEISKDTHKGLNPGQSQPTIILFTPQTPDILEITSQWNAIVDQIPPLGSEAEPSQNGRDFLLEYAPHRTDIEARQIRRWLTLIDMAPWLKDELKARLSEITKLHSRPLI